MCSLKEDIEESRRLVNRAIISHTEASKCICRLVQHLGDADFKNTELYGKLQKAGEEVSLLILKNEQFVALIAKQDVELCELRKFKEKVTKPIKINISGIGPTFKETQAAFEKLNEALGLLKKKPPIGVIPRKLWLEQRLTDVVAAVDRRVAENLWDDATITLVNEACYIKKELCGK